jgi:uncharacterized protein (DUF433 family)
MGSTSVFVSTAEAAFIAGLTDRDMNRIVDERIIPAPLVRVDAGRRFARLAAAFARFYFGTEELFAASLRRRVVAELVRRVEHADRRDAVLGLSAALEDIDWQFESDCVRIDASRFIDESAGRAREVERAEVAITVDSEVMSGVPVFAGTRVPLDVVLGSVDQGIPFERVKSAYPFLTMDLVEAARIYARVHPRRGRPRRPTDSLASLVEVRSRQARPARA